MSTLKQIEANRLNAQKSTGPVSETGRQTSSRNSFKTGLYAKSVIIQSESPEDFESLTREYYDHHQPQSPEERELLDSLIRQAWQLRRYDAVEAQLWEGEILDLQHLKWLIPEVALGQVFSRDKNDQKFARLHRMMAATQRLFRETIREIQRLQAARVQDRATDPEPESMYPTDSPASGSRPRNPEEQSGSPTPNGFVPSTDCATKDRAKAHTDPQPLAPNPQSLRAGPDPRLPLRPPLNPDPKSPHGAM